MVVRRRPLVTCVVRLPPAWVSCERIDAWIVDVVGYACIGSLLICTWLLCDPNRCNADVGEGSG